MSDHHSIEGNEPAGTSVSRLDEFRAIVARAQKGDRSAVPRLSQYLAINPQLWQRYGNLGRQVRMAWIRLAAGNDLYHQECLRWRAADMHQELVGSSTSRIVRLMAQRVVLAWLQDCYFAGMEAKALDKPEPLPLLHYRAKRGVQASRQYLMTLAAFATLRKLLPNEPAEDKGLADTCSSSPPLVPVPQPGPVSHPAPEPTAGPTVDAPASAPKPQVQGPAPRQRMKHAVTASDESIKPAVHPDATGKRGVRPRARAASIPEPRQTVASLPKPGRGPRRKRSGRQAPLRQPQPVPA